MLKYFSCFEMLFPMLILHTVIRISKPCKEVVSETSGGLQNLSSSSELPKQERQGGWIFTSLSPMRQEPLQGNINSQAPLSLSMWGAKVGAYHRDWVSGDVLVVKCLKGFWWEGSGYSADTIDYRPFLFGDTIDIQHCVSLRCTMCWLPP